MSRTQTATAGNIPRRKPTSVTNIRHDAEELDRRIRRFAREQPLLCLAMAIAGGYLVGRIVSRF